MATRKKYNLEYRIIAALRRVARFHPMLTQIKRLSALAPSVYLCNGCEYPIATKEDVTHVPQDKMFFEKVHVDHVEPVVPVEGRTTWDEYIRRLFPASIKDYQILCESCHYIKTQIENGERREYKKQKELL